MKVHRERERLRLARTERKREGEREEGGERETNRQIYVQRVFGSTASHVALLGVFPVPRVLTK